MNKYEKAYNELWSVLHNEPASEIELHRKENIQRLKTLEQLVKKTVPMKLDYEGDGYDNKGEIVYDTAICPSCSRIFEIDYDEHSNFCPSCGQALDWSGCGQDE